MSRKYADLWAAGFLTLAGFGLVLSRVSYPPLTAVFGILMALVLPGYVLSNVLLPHLDEAERILLSLGLSFVFNILGGLLLHLTPWGLRAETWAAWFLLMTLLFIFFAIAKRRSQAEDPAGQASQNPLVLDRRSGVFMASALAIVIASILIARSYASQNSALFTQLWARMEPASQNQVIQLGIENHEGQTMTYSIVMTYDSEVRERWQNIQVENGKRYQNEVRLPTPAPHRIQVFLFRQDDPSAIYRQVQLDEGLNFSETENP